MPKGAALRSGARHELASRYRLLLGESFRDDPMVVSERVRQIEQEIDEAICRLDVWRRPKASLLGQIMNTYRDAIEVVAISHFFMQTEGEALGLSAHEFGVLLMEESRHRRGVLWALKWASDFCSENGSTPDLAPEALVDLLALGARYEAFVDLLKRANHGAIAIKIDEQSKTLMCYEGEQATDADAEIVIKQRLSAPFGYQVSLTADEDQLTSHWTAGDYRRVLAGLAKRAAESGDRIVVDLASLAGGRTGEVAIPRPTIVWLRRPGEDPDRQVFDDLVLPVDGRISKWKLVALLDTPVVRIGDRHCALSSDLQAIARIDDYMLRLAALVDEDAYSRASTLRERRMIERCQAAFEGASQPWSIRTRVKFADPEQEADVIAGRGEQSVVVELKSTLRPETPWEVHKRNEDIIHGVKQAKALVDRGAGRQGFVLTDGYRGDYECWGEALRQGVPIGSLGDLPEIAHDPDAAAASLKAKVGIGSGAPRERLPDREETLMAWKIRLIDAAAPPP